MGKIINKSNTYKKYRPLTGAGEGNRTLVVSLEGFCSTIELHPPGPDKKCTISAPSLAPLHHTKHTNKHRQINYPQHRITLPQKSTYVLQLNHPTAHFYVSTSPNSYFTATVCDYRSSWWRRLDSNQRRRKPTDLQSAPFSHSGTPPNETVNYGFFKGRCQSSSLYIDNVEPLMRSQAANDPSPIPPQAGGTASSTTFSYPLTTAHITRLNSSTITALKAFP